MTYADVIAKSKKYFGVWKNITRSYVIFSEYRYYFVPYLCIKRTLKLTENLKVELYACTSFYLKISIYIYKSKH